MFARTRRFVALILAPRAVLLVGTAVLAVTACHRSRATNASGGGDAMRGIATGNAAVDADLATLRRATSSFHVLDSAVAAGYPRDVADCLVHEHHGAMGYHHVNRANLSRNLNVTKPQILLYQRMADGTYRLNGVEFILPFTLLSRDSTPPTILGQTMHREDNLKFWYLHVWAWNPNKDGVFANFHPDVTCPEGKSKVYTPFERSGDAFAGLSQ